jgi:GrpB-like predicted nucleotidyltransferase (UPF0157 family)
MLDYTAYTANDFALEQSFRQWILKKDAGKAVFWERWLAEHPEKRETYCFILKECSGRNQRTGN